MYICKYIYILLQLQTENLRSIDAHRVSMMDLYMIICLSGWWFQPLKNMSSSVGMIIPNMMENKKCSKPPTSVYILGFDQRMTGTSSDFQ